MAKKYLSRFPIAVILATIFACYFIGVLILNYGSLPFEFPTASTFIEQFPNHKIC